MHNDFGTYFTIPLSSSLPLPLQNIDQWNDTQSGHGFYNSIPRMTEVSQLYPLQVVALDAQ